MVKHTLAIRLQELKAPELVFNSNLKTVPKVDRRDVKDVCKKFLDLLGDEEHEMDYQACSIGSNDSTSSVHHSIVYR